MKRYWIESRHGQFLVVLTALVLYIVLLVTDAFRFFPATTTNQVSLIELCLRFGFSALVAALFLAVGSFTWLTARDRYIATLLFFFTTTSMMSVTTQTAAIRGDSLTSDIGGASSALSLLPLFALLFIFPHAKARGEGQKQKGGAQTARRSVLILFSLLAAVTVVDYLVRYLSQPSLPPVWLEFVGNIYFPLMIVSILLTLVLAFTRYMSWRERQQARFLLGGLVLAFVPLLLFTVLPVVTGHPKYALDGQVSSIFYLVLPLSLCYTVLRQELLIYDRTVQRTVAWIVGCISTAILGYVLVVTLGIAHTEHEDSLMLLSSVVGCALVLAPVLWMVAPYATERVLFREELQRRRKVQALTAHVRDQKVSLPHITRILVAAAQETFETQEACLFVHETQSSTYFFSPYADETHFQQLLERLQPLVEKAPHNDIWQIRNTVAGRLHASYRPLLLGDILPETVPARVSNYLPIPSFRSKSNVLLAPVRAQGVIIAILVLGMRKDQQPYGGPDFDLVQQLCTQFSSVLETARVTQALVTAYERLQEIDTLKDQFIMTASHELRTPLTAVTGYVDLLYDYNESLPPHRRADFIGKARLGCDELGLMVNNILDAYRVQVDVETTHLVPISLYESIQHVMEILQSLATRQDRTLRIALSSTIFVLADAGRLRQVLINLIGNALKYSPSDSPIEIIAREDAQKVTVCVCDRGPGIPPEAQDRLFERFVRLERDSNSPTRGTGLGLYICRRLIHAMNGDIWIESSGVQGEGSRFCFTLPLAPSQETLPLSSK